jgi:hypothetical protein
VKQAKLTQTDITSIYETLARNAITSAFLRVFKSMPTLWFMLHNSTRYIGNFNVLPRRMEMWQLSVPGNILEDRKFLYNPPKLNGKARMWKQCGINQSSMLRPPEERTTLIKHSTVLFVILHHFKSQENVKLQSHADKRPHLFFRIRNPCLTICVKNHKRRWNFSPLPSSVRIG